MEKVTCLDAFEMKGLRKILRVSWTAKKTNARCTQARKATPGWTTSRRGQDSPLKSQSE